MKNEKLTRPIPTNGTGSLKPDIWQGLDLTRHVNLRATVESVVAWYHRRAGGLILSGGTGCGKTHIARAILRACGGPLPILTDDLRSIRNAVFYAEPNLLADIRSSYGGGPGGEERIISACQWCTWLILDDVGVGYVKDESARWYEDIMWRIFDVRAENNLPTLLTTNLTPPELKTRLGQRAYSRLQQMLDEPGHFLNLFAVPDYRARKW